MSSWRGSWTWRPSASGSRRRSAKWTRASSSSRPSSRGPSSSSARQRRSSSASGRALPSRGPCAPSSPRAWGGSMRAPAKLSPPVVRLPSVESTQAVAWRLAAEGSPDRTVVVADHQSAGRGRRGRPWTDAPGTSLLASILVRPRVPLGLWPLFSLTTAVAAAEALRRSTGLEARLKWPNDVLARGRKLGGILLESRSGAHAPALVIGVGLNLAQREFSLELAGLATSVALETGSAPARDAVLAALLEEFDAWRARLESEGGEPVRVRWLALGETIGRQVSNVVPPVQQTLERMCEEYFGHAPYSVEPGVNTRMPLAVEAPREVGADRYVDAFAATARYGAPVIVIDFGTATTFNCVNARGEFIGGAIAPGLATSVEALVARAAGLYRVELVRTKEPI